MPASATHCPDTGTADALSPAAQIELIALLYEGAISARGWTDALRRLAQLTGSAQSHLLVWDHRDNRFRICEGFCDDPDARLRFLTEYNAEFQTIDPSKLVADRVAQGTVYQDHRNLGRFVIDKSPFYGDFFHRYGLHANMASRLAKHDDIEYVLSFQRERLHGHYRPRDEAVLLEVMPHLIRAARLRLEFSRLDDQARLSAAALDRLSFPVLVVDAAGAPALCNSLGRTWLETPECALRKSTQSPDRQRLVKVLRSACGVEGRRRPSGVVLGRRGPDGTGPDHALAIPLQERDGAGTTPLCLLVIQGPRWATVHLDGVLRDLFGLSPAESRLARLLFEEHSMQDAAERVCISIATARTQLKSIFAKTQLRRQTELIRLLSRLSVVGQGDPAGR
ncbi:MAG: helix-turn-helix transcriptional regulator [Gammaproteobacteria bacterium]|uniref:helix-turn-helix transcriptional regulator n=1 Tax=unclassified Pseudacidovorax TaxID=2620592 RepID=UPI001B4483AB|nr:hypothetical protein [Pseudacidovorax sp.]MBP6898245.1 hypothetical protein [Pseudacidovorax sp.]